MNIFTFFKKYYYVSIVLLGLFYPTQSSAQIATECVQAGGPVPCTIADLTYTVGLATGGLITGKDPEALKAKQVEAYCKWYKNGNIYMISCTPSPSTVSYASSSGPVYSYTIETWNQNPGMPPTKGTGWSYTISGHQTCPSIGKALLPNTWVQVCRIPYYSGNTIKPNLPSYLNPNKSSSIKGNMCTQEDANRNGNASVGDPIDVSTGVKTLSEVDYKYNSAQPFILQRSYNSVSNSWAFNFSKTLSYSNITSPIIVLSRPGGKKIVFQKVGGVWTETNGNSYYTITESGTKFIVKTDELETETYDLVTTSGTVSATYQLSESINVNGQKWLYEYQSGVISKIIDDYAREYTFTRLNDGSSCASAGNVKSMTAPGGKIISYDYNTSCGITKVTYPDGKFKQYTYSGGRLETVVDEKGNTYQKTTYNNNNYRATSEGLGSTGSIEKLSLNYLTNSVQVTDANNNVSTVNTQTTNNIIKITGYNSFCPWCSGYQGSSLTYDTNGNVSGIKDYKNVDTSLTYNSKGKPLTVTKAVGTALENTETYTYDVTGNFITSVTTPVEGGNKVTTYTYDGNNRITNVTMVAPKNDGSNTNETRMVSLTYNSLGQLTDIYGPRYVAGVVNDKTTLTYNSTGQVATSTNGLGQTTTFSNFDDFGNPQTITDPSGRVMNITYDLRGRVLTSTFKSSALATDGETTTFTYDNAGLITQISTPSGAYKKMYYDLVQRLNKIEEYDETNTYLGKVEFTLDNMSNMTALKVFNASNVQIRTSTNQYDAKSRLFKDIGSLNQTDAFTYDNNSNLTQVNDAANNNTTRSYDVLNRLAGQTNPDTGTIGVTYKPDGNIATITDPKSLTTTYSYNGFGEMISMTSPDTGITTITRDKAGNPISYVDAKGQVSTMTYDVLNRITNVDYVGASSENVTITYDSCTNGIGKVCLINDISGTQTYSYNSKGRLVSKTYTNGTFSKTVGYSYNNNGQLSSITYPSGKMVMYNYVNNKVSSLSYMDGSVTTDIATNINYEAFNPRLSSYTWGNSATYNQSFTADGVISSINAANAYPVNKSYGYDSRFNITAITETGNSARSSTATYDSMSRINNYSYGTGNSNDYTYNTSEDRTSQKLNGGTTTTYNYDSASHKLTSLSGGSTDSMTYDANGNILTASGKTYTYNAANRMATSNDGTITTNYLINFMGQRTQKANSNETTWFIYDENDNVIAEYDVSGNLQNEYIYLNDKPIALLRNSNLYYIYTDHLNTPRAITDTANNMQWVWENKEAFGNNAPTEIISGFKFNLRFPGQYFDNETNLNYNIHRDYNPVWGRYTTSDPLGLAAGINTYGYVGGNSLGVFDKLGLSQNDVLKIQQIFKSTINKMVINGDRRSSDSWLPNNGFPLFADKKYEICEGQITIMQLALNNSINSYDDNWRFQAQSGFGHFWMVAISSNKEDPIIYLDPWNDSIGVGKPCKGCSGWLGRNYDYNQYLKNKTNNIKNSYGWYEGWDLTPPIPKGVIQ